VLAFHVWTGPESSTSPWFSRGSADAAAIVRGEWWRTVTALTLHADAGHAVGNAVLGGLLLALLAHALGPGLAAILMVLAGSAGTSLLPPLRGRVAQGALASIAAAVPMAAWLAAFR